MTLCSSFQLARIAALTSRTKSVDGDSSPEDPLPWPDDIVLYLPTNSQLTADYLARSLSVISIFKLCNLNFKIERAINAEFLGPDKLWPVVRSGDKMATGFETILQYVRLMGYLPSSKLAELEQAEIITFLVYIDSTFHSTEKFFCWCLENEFESRTKPGHFSFHWKPLSFVLPFMKRWEIKSNLKVLGYPANDLGKERILSELTTLCIAVSSKLEQNEKNGVGFLFGSKLTEVDAVFASHIEALEQLYASFPDLKKLFKQDYPRLDEHSKMCMEHLANPKALIFSD